MYSFSFKSAKTKNNKGGSSSSSSSSQMKKDDASSSSSSSSLPPDSLKTSLILLSNGVLVSSSTAAAAASAMATLDESCSSHLSMTLPSSSLPLCATLVPLSDIITNGRTLDETYEIGKSLGSGAFGMVREVTHRKTEEKYAVKIIQTKSLKENQIARLWDEIRVMHAVKGHPNIVTLQEVFLESVSSSPTNKPVYCLVMEEAHGGELFDRIAARNDMCCKEESQYTELEARDASFGILCAIQHCHRRRIVHRDLKPKNILLVSNDCSNWTTQLCDFGLAKVVRTPNSLTTYCGTKDYMAPEIIHNGDSEGYDVPVDMWSLGVLLYVLLSGYLPFDGSAYEVQNQILTGDYSFDDEFWKQYVSQDAKQLISVLMEVDPCQRLTADQALQSNWMTKNQGALRRHSLDKSLERLRQFNVRQKWKVVCDAIIAAKRMSVVCQTSIASLAEAI